MPFFIVKNSTFAEKGTKMKDEDDVFSKFRDSFSRTNGHFHILEQRVPVEVQMSYFKFSENLRKENNPPRPLNDEQCLQNYAILKLETTSAEEKKTLLSTLATSKNVKAYRLLEQYVKEPDPDVASWAYMALMESRISLESEFTDERQVYISTGLGGKDDKLRFYALLLSTDNQPFKEYQTKMIEQELPFAFKEAGWELEKLHLADGYVEAVFLLPVKAEIKEVFDHLITECNQYGNFLSPVYSITNIKEYSEEEIQKAIQQNGDSKSSH